MADDAATTDYYPPAPKPLLVGEGNPYGSDPRYALYPEPERSAGGRVDGEHCPKCGPR